MSLRKHFKVKLLKTRTIPHAFMTILTKYYLVKVFLLSEYEAQIILELEKGQLWGWVVNQCRGEVLGTVLAQSFEQYYY